MNNHNCVGYIGEAFHQNPHQVPQSEFTLTPTGRLKIRCVNCQRELERDQERRYRLKHRDVVNAKSARHRAKVKFAVTGGKLIPSRKTKIQIGDRFGKLTVIEYLGLGKYGNSNRSYWKLKCDCGETITLPTKRFAPSSDSPRHACDKCSQKTCVICGEKYSHLRQGSVCTSPACINLSRKNRDKEAQQRRKIDSNYRELLAHQGRLRRANLNASEEYQKVKTRRQNAPDAIKEARATKSREYKKRYKKKLSESQFIETATSLIEKGKQNE